MVRKEDLVSLANFRKALRRYLRFVEEGARAVNITPQQHQLLLAVGGTPDRDWATVGEVADALQLRHHAAVGLVDRCVRAGLVYRAPGEEDKRVVRVFLTPKGGDILDRLSAQNLGELKGALKELASDIEKLAKSSGAEPQS